MGMLTDCNGTAVTSEKIAEIRLNIFKTYMGKFFPVTEYENVSISRRAILDEPQIDCEGNVFNVDFDPDDGINPPFPERSTQYVVELIFVSTTGSRSVRQLEVRSK